MPSLIAVAPTVAVLRAEPAGRCRGGAPGSGLRHSVGCAKRAHAVGGEFRIAEQPGRIGETEHVGVVQVVGHDMHRGVGDARKAPGLRRECRAPASRYGASVPSASGRVSTVIAAAS